MTTAGPGQYSPQSAEPVVLGESVGMAGQPGGALTDGWSAEALGRSRGGAELLQAVADGVCPVNGPVSLSMVAKGVHYPRTRWRSRAKKPARPCIWRAMRLVLVLTPSVGPLLYGSVSAASTALAPDLGQGHART